MSFIGWLNRNGRLHPVFTTPVKASDVSPEPKIEPHRCPECERKGYPDSRGYFHCEECGISW